MNFINISEELEEMAYLTQINESINSMTIGISNSKGELQLDSISRVESINNKMYFIYFIRQVPIEREFKTIDELLGFIKEVFPIER